MMTIKYEKFDNSPDFVDVPIGDDNVVSAKETNAPTQVKSNDSFRNIDTNPSKLSAESDATSSSLNNSTNLSNYRQTSGTQEQVVIIQGLNKSISEDVFSKDNVYFMIENKFPSKLVVESIVFCTLVNLCLFFCQMLAMIFKAPYHYIGTGIWTGLYMLCLQALCLNLAKKPSVDIFRLLVALNNAGLFINLASIIINIVALRDTCLGNMLVRDVVCTESDYAGFNATMTVLSIGNCIFCFYFVESLQRWLKKIWKARIRDQSSNLQGYSNPVVQFRAFNLE